MKIQKSMSNRVVLTELGQRLKDHRLNAQLTQQSLASEAGVSKRTVERMEAGQSTQFINIIAVCRVLNLLENLNSLIPEPGPSPMDMLKLQGKRRQRASSPDSSKPTDSNGGSATWTWSDSE